jgi:hypothetical protein
MRESHRVCCHEKTADILHRENAREICHVITPPIIKSFCPVSQGEEWHTRLRAKQSTKASKHPKATPNFSSNRTNGERQQCNVEKGKQMKQHHF